MTDIPAITATLTGIDLSRLYIVSGRTLFDDDDTVELIEADSLADAEAHFIHLQTTAVEWHENDEVLIISSRSMAEAYLNRSVSREG